MGMEKQQCPKCGNWVEGKKRQVYAKKIATAGVKTAVNSAASVGATSTGAANGSAILPGIGTVIGGAAGFLASTMFHTAVNDGIDIIADGADEILSDDIQYEYTCPKCGNVWSSQNISPTSTTSSISISSQQNTASESSNEIRNLLLNEIKECTKTSYVINEWNSLRFINLDDKKARLLQMNLSKKYGVFITTTDILHCAMVKDLINMIINRVPNSDVFSSITQNNNQLKTEKKQEDLFNEQLNYLLNKKEEIIQNLQTAKKFIQKIETISSKIENNVIRSEFLFLQAICCFYYTIEHDNDKSLCKKGEIFINQAKQFYYDDEYTVFQLIFKSYNINHEESNIASIQEKISKLSPAILEIKDTLFKPEYLLNIYEDSRHNSLLESCTSLENRKQYKESEKCWIMMTQLSNSFSKFVGNYYLYSYYLSGIGDIKESAEKCFFYCKKVVDLYDLEKDFDKDNINHQRWLECLSILGSCYLDGDGTNKDYKKGFDISLRAALLGDKESMLELGEVFELGKGVFPNLQKAIEWYQKAADLGDEYALQKLTELSSNNLNNNNIKEASQKTFITVPEQEYLDEVKVCLEEDVDISPRERRLLNRLREKLGISEVRAQELEASLLKPQLTDEEKEYIEEYKACLEEGNTISDKERRLLEKLRKVLGISPERANELETI